MINKVILVGNVGIDPEVRAIESGVKVARVRLATTERIFNRQTNESTEHTEWHTVILWRGLADVVDRFVRKGSQLYISFTNFTSQKKLGKLGRVFATTKGLGHGLGLSRIENIVEKHDGYLSFNSEDGAFTAEILLPQE